MIRRRSAPPRALSLLTHPRPPPPRGAGGAGRQAKLSGCAEGRSIVVLVSARPPDDQPDNFDPATGGSDSLQQGSPASATLAPVGDQDFFQFTASAGNVYKIRATVLPSTSGALESIGVKLTLFDPDRAAVATAASAGGVAEIRLFRPRHIVGPHFVRVEAADGSATGSYQVELTATRDSRPPPPAMQLSTTSNGSELVATLRTEGTSFPIGLLQIFLELDRRHLLLRPDPAALTTLMRPGRGYLCFGRTVGTVDLNSLVE